MPAQAGSTTIWLKCRREARKFKPAALALPGNSLRFEQSAMGRLRIYGHPYFQDDLKWLVRVTAMCPTFHRSDTERFIRHGEQHDYGLHRS